MSDKMVKVTSVSGGMTSAYLAANYKSDHLLFALVRTDDKNCSFKDRKIAKIVEDRIQKPFMGTLEDDMIIYTILDLEQFLGQKINWVSGLTFDEVVEKKGGWLPNKLHRYCTTWMKIDPMFYWWAENVGKPVEMQIGFRANEGNRIKRSIDKCNEKGLLEYNASFEKHNEGRHKGLNKWEVIEWQKPIFPLYEDQVYKDSIIKYWKDKPVRFAERNNCVGCFHRNPMLLNMQAKKHSNKMEWFAKQEERENVGTWRSDVRYRDIINYDSQIDLFDDDFSECDSGYCEVN